MMELPLLSCVMSASCPLASSSTRMRVIKISKDVSFCCAAKSFGTPSKIVVVYQLCQLPPNYLQSLYLRISILPRSFGSLVLDPPPIFHPLFDNGKIYWQHTSLHQPSRYHTRFLKLSKFSWQNYKLYHNNYKNDRQDNSKDKSENCIHLLYTYLFFLDGD